MTNADRLKVAALKLQLPERTIDQVVEALDACESIVARETLVRMMLRHGRITSEAREFLLTRSQAND